MKFIPVLIIACCLLSGLTSAQTMEDTMEQRTLMHDNRERHYLVYTPSAYDETKSYALLLLLHPASTTAQEMAEMTHVESLADTHNVVLVFPNAVSGRWNSSGMLAPDDVGFLTQLIDTMIAKYAVDDARVFVLGYSSGGLMTMKLRCVLADRLRGIISFAAPMTFAIANDCLSAEPVSALVIHGTQDEIFPYAGQASVDDGELSGTFSLDQTIGFLASLNKCRSRPQSINISTEQGMTRGQPIFATRYDCADGIATELYTVAGLGHFNWIGYLEVKLGDDIFSLNEAIFRFMTVTGASS